MSIFSIAYPSDVHLGHPNTTTAEILQNLRNAFPPSMETESLDMIIFTGDVFDRLLSFPDDPVSLIEEWVNDFLRMCKKFNIIVRILEGTPSHDWKQSNVFEKINKIAQIDADVKHVTTLSIEYIEKVQKSFLYIPDEWLPEPDDTWKQVKETLALHNLKQVDFSIMHGSFPHQLPAHIKVPMHNPERYLSITKYIVTIGHIHKPAIWDRIFTPGSFDRLCHGEEEAKGHIRFYLNKDDTWKVVFIENEGAKIYKTINCLGLDVETALDKITTIVKPLPKDSYVRIEADKEDAIIVSLDLLKNKFSNIVWSTKIATKSNTGKEMLVDMRAKFQGIDITKDNIIDMLMNRISLKQPQINSRCRELLQEVIADD